jgi:hypothetical protein
MITENNLALRHTQPPHNEVFDPQLVRQPGDHGLLENAAGSGKGLHRCHQQPLELEKRLFKEDHEIDLLARDSSCLEAKLYSLRGKIIIVLFSREPFFLRRGKEFSIAQKSRGGVVEKT